MRARLAACVLVLLASAAFALEVPPPPTTFVTDKAGILSESDAHALNEKLAAFEQRSGAQFIIYVFPALDDEALEDFTIRCAEKWKVGNKKYDNGLILFVFNKERKLRIEVGYGLEPTVTDAFSSRVLRESIAPHFRQGDYVGGLNAAADALIAQIEHKEAPVPPAQRPGAGGSATGSIFGLLFTIFLIIMIASLITRSRPGCGGCFWPMFFLGGGSGRGFGGGGWGGGGGGWSGFGGGGGSFGGGGASGGW